ncbi:hypothetical protein JCM3774_001802 [Rhodotorula dairenensis]
MPTPTPIAPAAAATATARTSLPPLAPRPPLPGGSTGSNGYPAASSSAATTNHPPPPPPSSAAAAAPTAPTASAPAPPPRKKRRNKVDSACRFCRKSHMQCSGERPCARCIKREIAHLCTDAPFPSPSAAAPPPPPAPAPAPAAAPSTAHTAANVGVPVDLAPKAESPSQLQQSLPPSQPYASSSAVAAMYQVAPTPAVTVSSSAEHHFNTLGLLDLASTPGGPGAVGGRGPPPRPRATSSSGGSASISPGQASNSLHPTQHPRTSGVEDATGAGAGGSAANGRAATNGFAQLLAGTAADGAGTTTTTAQSPFDHSPANADRGAGPPLGKRESHNSATGADGSRALATATAAFTSGSRSGSGAGSAAGAGYGGGGGGGGGGDQPALPQQQQQNLYTPDFNMAMLDLANDGLGSGLGLDMTSTGEGEFHGLGLSEFLASLDAPLFTTTAATATATSTSAEPHSSSVTSHSQNHHNLVINTNDTGLGGVSPRTRTVHLDDGGGNKDGTATLGAGADKNKSLGPSVPGSPVNKTERFLLTAADQKDGSRSDRLARVIHAKFEAGLLRPYNHVAGYTRLMKWMADNMSANSRQRTLHTLSEFRPTFRAIASGLTDLDLVFIEEAFERLLLDYDRVFSSMGIPSCLWRRTGEIYKGNKEFAALVGVPIEDLQGGKLAIYELMAEESAVNYWEKYGNIAFDVGQKAVLTSCVLINQSILSRKRKKAGADKRKVPDDAMVNACFSFTIRRDSYGIPSMIVGNFIKL